MGLPVNLHHPLPFLPARRSKAAGLAAPFYFKRAVDAMSSSAAALGSAGAAQAAAAGLVLFGACRALSGVAKELQGPVFAPVSQVRVWLVLGTSSIQLRCLQRRAWGAEIPSETAPRG